MNAKVMVTQESDVVATAIVKFMKDRSIQVKLSTCDGVNARMCDALPGAIFKELNTLRAKKRLADTVSQHELMAKQRAEEEAVRRANEEKANAT